jgi:vomeronasal1 receptor
MFPNDPILIFFLLPEIFIGYMGNSLLFILQLYTDLTQPHLKKPIDVIFTHLTPVNVFTIVFRWTPDIMPPLGVRFFLYDVCRSVLMFAYSVTHGLSICITFLLSTFQAITISPSNSK